METKKKKQDAIKQQRNIKGFGSMVEHDILKIHRYTHICVCIYNV